jgi:hypothetical protein
MTTAISTKCSICKHIAVDEINAKLVSGVSPATLAEQYDVGKMALHRHKNNHLPKVLVQSQQLKEADAADNLLDKVQGIYDEAWRLMRKAEGDGKYAPAVSALKEARTCLELIGRLLGELKSGPVINVMYNPEFIEARLTITEALKPYPEARQAVINALTDGGVIDADFDEAGDTAQS